MFRGPKEPALWQSWGLKLEGETNEERFEHLKKQFEAVGRSCCLPENFMQYMKRLIDEGGEENLKQIENYLKDLQDYVGKAVKEFMSSNDERKYKDSERIRVGEEAAQRWFDNIEMKV